VEEVARPAGDDALENREIERKFLVSSDTWRDGTPGVPMRQGYLSEGTGTTVRVRIAGVRAWLTIKGRAEHGVRPEFEYEIPVAEAESMLAHCTGEIIEKERYRVPHAGHMWEVDVFAEVNQPLITAEVELDAADETVELPPWVGREVTGELRYLNAVLARLPYSAWPEDSRLEP
jgi:adenylate cyclase